MNIFDMKKLLIYSLILVVAMLCALSFYIGTIYKSSFETEIHRKKYSETTPPAGEIAMMCVQFGIISLLFIDQQKPLNAATILTVNIDHNIRLMSENGTPEFDSYFSNKEDRNIVVYNSLYKKYLNIREKYKYKGLLAKDSEDELFKIISEQRPKNQSELDENKDDTKKLINKLMSK